MSEPMKSSPVKHRTPNIEMLTESFLHSMSGRGHSAREAWYARETMLSLIRLVRSEQLMAIKCSVRKLVPDAASMATVKLSKSKRISRRQPGQKQLAFGRED